MEIKENIPLAQYTTIKIGGSAKFFVEAENEDEIIEALNYAQEKKLPVFILGGGSNVLFSDQGFDGMVIKILDTKYQIQDTEMLCGAGCSLIKIVLESIKADLTGLEWAAGIPGTIGGAVAGNAGAFGGEMSEVIQNVNVLEISNIQYLPPGRDPAKAAIIPNKNPNAKIPMPNKIQNPKSKNIFILNNKDCQFSYRDSIFKKNPNLIILSCALRLKKGDSEKSQQIVADIMRRRKALQPYDFPSSGSFFKNPVIKRENIVAEYEEDTGKKAAGNVIPAGYLIDRLGLRGKKIGTVMVSEMHGNFLVNTGNGKAEDVIILASLIKQKVRNHFGAQLKEEVQLVGF